MAVDAFPFFLDFSGADGGGGGTDADSVGSTLERLVRRFDEDSVASGAADACSGLASRTDAFRFLDDGFGGGGAGAVGACWLVSGVWEVDEPAESLAAERVTLEDMRMRLTYREIRRSQCASREMCKCDCGLCGWMEMEGCSCSSYKCKKVVKQCCVPFVDRSVLGDFAMCKVTYEWNKKANCSKVLEWSVLKSGACLPLWPSSFELV
jgi:hypothetical protein